MLFSLLVPPHGLERVWSSHEEERAAWALERESFMRQLEREREAWMRERDLLLEREATAVARLQKQIDFSEGLLTVRSVLESIVASAFPNTPAMEALCCYCNTPNFLAYLAAVSAASDFSTASLVKSAKGAIHGGSTHATDATAVPQAVPHDSCTLHAIAAIFMFERRDVRLYLGGRPFRELKLPLPPRPRPPSAASSAASSLRS